MKMKCAIFIWCITSRMANRSIENTVSVLDRPTIIGKILRTDLTTFQNMRPADWTSEFNENRFFLSFYFTLRCGQKRTKQKKTNKKKTHRPLKHSCSFVHSIRKNIPIKIQTHTKATMQVKAHIDKSNF